MIFYKEKLLCKREDSPLFSLKGPPSSLLYTIRDERLSETDGKSIGVVNGRVEDEGWVGIEGQGSRAFHVDASEMGARQSIRGNPPPRFWTAPNQSP